MAHHGFVTRRSAVVLLAGAAALPAAACSAAKEQLITGAIRFSLMERLADVLAPVPSM
jgi:hypothetical protein